MHMAVTVRVAGSSRSRQFSNAAATSVACSSSTEPSFRPPSSRADSQLCYSSLLNSLLLDGTSVPSAH